MIISASCRTDIPAFYGEWFMHRLHAGYCFVLNPYSQKPYYVSLARADVDGIVFWTKNLLPFEAQLAEVHRLGYPCVVQYTINGYPRTLEFSVVDVERSLASAQRVAQTYGAKTLVWRYDPIVASTALGEDFHAFHQANFRRIAQTLEGHTDEVVISFAQLYKKTLKNMNWAARKFEFAWHDPTDEAKLALAADLVTIAREYGMQLKVCAQLAYTIDGAQPAHCIDAERLAQIAGTPFKANIRGTRAECACYEYRDIGDYDTCPHGCVYCYAVRDRQLAQLRYHQHNPTHNILFGDSIDEGLIPATPKQLPLF